MSVSPALNSAQWALLRAQFDELLPCTPTQREALIARAALQTELEAELRSLLHHHDESGTTGQTVAILGPSPAENLSFVDGGPTLPETPERPDSAVRVGTRLGAWVLQAELGSGGVGQVFEARRADGQFEGRAAVKLLKRGMDSAAVLQRFALERQALARLNHPHIARLLDAGASAEGLPYFVMEHVDGLPIDQAAKSLSLAQKLTLFLQLTDAVSHAHRNLLVHRDLKPGNVLVDAEGQVKLLDFGIAKALDPLEAAHAADDGDTTVGGQRPFTPQYASPEQVRGEPVSTATDIYSLGVLLYQLLTGTRPTGRQASTAQAVARCVIDETPTRPSRLGVADVPDPKWLHRRKRLQGDLDNIVLKALEKQPERRYPSVDALAADLKAHLRGFPVSARAPSATYVAGKFLRRNAWAAAALGLGLAGLLSGLAAAALQGRVAAALGMVGLAAGLGLALLQAGKAARARDQALSRFEDVRQMVHTVLFDYHDLIEALPDATPVRQRLVQDAQGYLGRLLQSAPADRAVRREIGTAFRVIGVVQRNGFRRPHLGDTAGALHSYAQAIKLLDKLVAEDPQDEASAYELGLALSARASVWGEDGDLAAASPPLHRAAELFALHMQHDTRDSRHRLELARTHLRLADARRFNDDHAGAWTAMAQAQQVLHSLAALAPAHAELPHVWDWVNGVHCALLRERRDWVGMCRLMDESLRNLQRMHQREPANARYLEDMAGASQWMLFAVSQLKDVPATQRWSQETSERWSEQARRDPDNHQSRRNLLHALVFSGKSLCDAGAPALALQRLHEVWPALDSALQRWPNQVEVRVHECLWLAAKAECEQALGEQAQGDPRVVASTLQQAQSLQETLASQFGEERNLLTAAALLQLTQARWQARSLLARRAEGLLEDIETPQALSQIASVAQLTQLTEAMQACVQAHQQLKQREQLAAGPWAAPLDEAKHLLAALQATAGGLAAAS